MASNSPAVRAERFERIFHWQDKAYDRLEEIKRRLSEIEARLKELDKLPDPPWQGQSDWIDEYQQLVAEQSDLYAEVNEIEMGTWRDDGMLH